MTQGVADLRVDFHSESIPIAKPSHVSWQKGSDGVDLIVLQQRSDNATLYTNQPIATVNVLLEENAMSGIAQVDALIEFLRNV